METLIYIVIAVVILLFESKRNKKRREQLMAKRREQQQADPFEEESPFDEIPIEAIPIEENDSWSNLEKIYLSIEQEREEEEQEIVEMEKKIEMEPTQEEPSFLFDPKLFILYSEMAKPKYLD